MKSGPETCLDEIAAPNRTSSVTVREALLQWIRRNDLAVGDRLPPQTQLSKAFGTGTRTIQNVMTELVEAGIIRRRPGEGTVLLRPPDDAPVPGAPGNGTVAANGMLKGPLVIALVGLVPDRDRIPHSPYQTDWLEIRGAETALHEAAADPQQVLTQIWAPEGDPAAVLGQAGAHGAVVVWLGDAYRSPAWKGVRQKMLRLDIPAVHIGEVEWSGGGLPNLVCRDDFAIGVAAARHLCGLGHERLMVACSRARLPFERARCEGFMGYVAPDPNQRASVLAGRAAEATPIWRPVGEQAFEQWFASAPDKRATAIFCVNDATAAGFILAARTAGVRVPEDVSVMGVDNYHGLFYPEGIHLTTLDPRCDQLGAEAVRLLGRLLTGEPGHDTIVKVRPHLVARFTTASRTDR